MVQKTANKKFRVQVKIAGKVRGGVFTRKDDAEKCERELKREQELTRAGMERPKERLLLVDYAADWMRRRERDPEIKKSTLAADEQRLRAHVLPYLGGRVLSTIKSDEIKDHLDKIQNEKGLSNATRNRCRAVLHTLFDAAYMEGRLVSNPVGRVPLVKERTKRQADPLSKEEIEKILAACETQEDTFLVLTFLYCGGRVSQISGLQNRDFDLRNNTLTFSRIWEYATHSIRDGIKGRDEGLTIPLFPVLAAEFTAHMARTKFSAPTDFVFPNHKGLPRSVGGLRSRVYTLCRYAKIREVSPHVLRATFATLAEEQGFSKEDIQRMLGHSTVLVTQKYVRRGHDPLLEKAIKSGFGAVSPAANVVQIKKGKT